MVMISPRTSSCWEPSGGSGIWKNSSAVISFRETVAMMTSSPLAHCNPFLCPRRFQDGIQYQLRLIAVAEVRLGRCAGLHSLEEIRQSIDERMLVADGRAGHPPVLMIGVLEIGDVDVAPAGQV